MSRTLFTELVPSQPSVCRTAHTMRVLDWIDWKSNKRSSLTGRTRTPRWVCCGMVLPVDHARDAHTWPCLARNSQDMCTARGVPTKLHIFSTARRKRPPCVESFSSDGASTIFGQHTNSSGEQPATRPGLLVPGPKSVPNRARIHHHHHHHHHRLWKVADWSQLSPDSFEVALVQACAPAQPLRRMFLPVRRKKKPAAGLAPCAQPSRWPEEASTDTKLSLW